MQKGCEHQRIEWQLVQKKWTGQKHYQKAVITLENYTVGMTLETEEWTEEERHECLVRLSSSLCFWAKQICRCWWLHLQGIQIALLYFTNGLEKDVPIINTTGHQGVKSFWYNCVNLHSDQVGHIETLCFENDILDPIKMVWHSSTLDIDICPQLPHIHASCSNALCGIEGGQNEFLLFRPFYLEDSLYLSLCKCLHPKC